MNIFYRLKKMTMRAVSQGTIRRHNPDRRLHPELPKRKSRHLKLEDAQKTLLTTPVEKPQLQFVRDMFDPSPLLPDLPIRNRKKN